MLYLKEATLCEWLFVKICNQRVTGLHILVSTGVKFNM